MKELNDSIYSRILDLSQQGNDLVNAGDNLAALRKYHEAWRLLPEPKEDWDAATWLLSAIGDTHFLSSDYQNAVAALTNAIACPNGLGNPFIHLRLGQSHFEMGNTSKAADELARAYMVGGRELFEKVEQKYFVFLKSILKPPIGQDSI
jgi:tetratricopeptide (TPR) repeat protein